MMSLPTAPTSEVCAPIRATATAWFAPLPPGKNRRFETSMLSPSLGSRSALTTMSKFVLPYNHNLKIFRATRHKTPLGRSIP